MTQKYMYSVRVVASDGSTIKIFHTVAANVRDAGEAVRQILFESRYQYDRDIRIYSITETEPIDEVE